jgi:hypothetical protein
VDFNLGLHRKRCGGERERTRPAEVQSKLTPQWLYPNPKCGADFDAHIGRQFDLYTRLIPELNIKTE